ncbi:MAG: GAF domain-containing protein [Armatimonadota bacterium]
MEETRALRERLERRELELDAVRRLSADLRACLDPDELARRALRAAMGTVEAHAGGLLLHDPDRDTLEFCAVVSDSEAVETALLGAHVAPGDPAWLVFDERHGRVDYDISADLRHYFDADAIGRTHRRSMIRVPMIGSCGDCIGVLEVADRRRGAFDQTDCGVLEILAGQAASAIETARLHARILREEAERERFYREVIRCVTHDCLRLVDHAEVPTEGRQALQVDLSDPAGYPMLRNCLRELATSAGMSEDGAEDFILAAGEAATNAIKHADGGTGSVYLTESRIIVRIADTGSGIRSKDLPATLLLPGFSTKASLGMGFTLILKLVDRVWLATDCSGTVVQLEKSLVPVDDDEWSMSPLLEDSWARL